jgi:hypothetical protein
MLPFKKSTGKAIILFLTASIILLIGHPLFSNFKDKLRTTKNTHIPLVVLIDNGKGQLVPEPRALLETSYFHKGSEVPEFVDSIRTNRHGRGKLLLPLKEDTIVKLETISRSRGKKPAKNKKHADQQIFIGVDSQETADRIISEAKDNNELIVSLQPFPEENTIYVGAPDPQDRNILYIHGKDRTQSGEIRFSISQKTKLNTLADRPQRQSSTTQKINKSLMPGSEEALYFENYTWENTYDPPASNLYEIYDFENDATAQDNYDSSSTDYFDYSMYPDIYSFDYYQRNCPTYYNYEYNYCRCNELNPCGCGQGEEALARIIHDDPIFI